MSRLMSVATGAAGLLIGATAMAAAGAHWTGGNVNAVNQLLGSRSGWQFVYLPPPDADVPPPDPEHGLFGVVDRYAGLDQHIAIGTVPPPDADLPPPDADRPVNILVPGDGTSPTLIRWTVPPDPELPPGPGIDLAFPTDPHANVLINLQDPPDPEHPRDSARTLTIEYPPDPGVPTTIVLRAQLVIQDPPEPEAPIDIEIPTGANLALHDPAGNALALCEGGTYTPPTGR